MVLLGNSPSTSVMIFIQLFARPMSACLGVTVAMLFSLLHATSHAAQPVQRSRSITMPHRLRPPGLLAASLIPASRRDDPHGRAIVDAQRAGGLGMHLDPGHPWHVLEDV